MKIVLFEPQIPQNAGNIVRTCSATGASLVLVHPFGFSTSSRHLKRAGLDYWDGVSVEETNNLEVFLEDSKSPFFFFSSKASKAYTEAPYTDDSLLIFGSETTGLPPHFFQKWEKNFYTIPMRKGARCLNLANSAAIVLYEALRQNQFLLLNNAEKMSDKTRLISTDVASGK